MKVRSTILTTTTAALIAALGIGTFVGYITDRDEVPNRVATTHDLLTVKFPTSMNFDEYSKAGEEYFREVGRQACNGVNPPVFNLGSAPPPAGKFTLPSSGEHVDAVPNDTKLCNPDFVYHMWLNKVSTTIQKTESGW
jgi:hypothetical protein